MSTVTSLLAGRGNLTSDETRCVHTHVTQRKWFRRASERATDGRPSRQRCAIRRSLSASVGCPDDEDVNDAHCRPADTQPAQRVLLVHVPSVSFCRPSPVYEPLFTMPLSLPSTTREGQYRYWKTFSFIWCIRVQHVKYDISIFRTDSMAGLPGPILLSISVFNFCFFFFPPLFNCWLRISSWAHVKIMHSIASIRIVSIIFGVDRKLQICIVLYSCHVINFVVNQLRGHGIVASWKIVIYCSPYNCLYCV